MGAVIHILKYRNHSWLTQWIQQKTQVVGRKESKSLPENNFIQFQFPRGYLILEYPF